jgi:hypothetical protein
MSGFQQISAEAKAAADYLKSPEGIAAVAAGMAASHAATLGPVLAPAAAATLPSDLIVATDVAVAAAATTTAASSGSVLIDASAGPVPMSPTAPPGRGYQFGDSRNIGGLVSPTGPPVAAPVDDDDWAPANIERTMAR